MDFIAGEEPPLAPNFDWGRLADQVERWALSAPEEAIERFNKAIVGATLQRDAYEPLLRAWAMMICPYAEELGILNSSEHSNELLSSTLIGGMGLMGIYWAQFHVEHVPGGHLPHHIEGWVPHTVDFTLLYAYVDHYFDSRRPTPKEKAKILDKLMILLEDPDCCDPPPGFKGLIDAYRRLLDISPMAKSALKLVFLTEVLGLKYQSDPNLDLEDALKICELKGGRTATAFQSIIGGQQDVNVYRVGACIQLLDDMMDINDDVRAGIYTVATCHLKKYGTLDKLMAYTVERICSISNLNPLIKVLLMEVATYILGRLPYFSPMLKRRLKPSIHVRYDKKEELQILMSKRIRELIYELVGGQD